MSSFAELDNMLSKEHSPSPHRQEVSIDLHALEEEITSGKKIKRTVPSHIVRTTNLWKQNNKNIASKMNKGKSTPAMAKTFFGHSLLNNSDLMSDLENDILGHPRGKKGRKKSKPKEDVFRSTTVGAFPNLSQFPTPK